MDDVNYAVDVLAPHSETIAPDVALYTKFLKEQAGGYSMPMYSDKVMDISGTRATSASWRPDGVGEEGNPCAAI